LHLDECLHITYILLQPESIQRHKSISLLQVFLNDEECVWHSEHTAGLTESQMHNLTHSRRQSLTVCQLLSLTTETSDNNT